MAVRTVRLTQGEEDLLSEIRRQTGMGTSATLRRGLIALQRSLIAETPYEVYRRLGLGRARGAAGPARERKRQVAAEIRRKAEAERIGRPAKQKSKARAAGQ